MNESYREISINITANDDGLTAREIMAVRLCLSSREITRCKQFEDGVCLKSGKRAEGDVDSFVPILVKTPLSEGDVLRIRIYEDNDNAGEVIPWDTPIDIVYEDEDIILINKPGDMVVHPSYAHYQDSLSNALAGYYQKTGQDHVIRTIGRLDRETSGLLIFAKNRYSAALLSNQRMNMSKRKEYLALASGVFEKKEGTIDAPIGQEEGVRMIRKVIEDGKRAITHYKVVQQFEDYALVRLRLDTGRTHQIRVHMSYLGHPLLGDNLYGKEISDSHGMTRAALHAAHLEFKQPVTGKELSFEAQLPEDMKRLV
ncbi:RluA family pseudouridine synthase [Butyrivibrio sp. CB08]|uniref:RluA family pseudouridine synthase n=1 Tax=Butyrivibrio sp. CB08 TaxID=2364879 RepID=UPI000EA93E03|nr:RluA family pseudouridine synthase [Butyrivibrio sp. CB08]RKM61047.1 RluA family pseudouridine synthase [Butyrivibrio sp. CB08]